MSASKLPRIRSGEDFFKYLRENSELDSDPQVFIITQYHLLMLVNWFNNNTDDFQFHYFNEIVHTQGNRRDFLVNLLENFNMKSILNSEDNQELLEICMAENDFQVLDFLIDAGVFYKNFKLNFNKVCNILFIRSEERDRLLVLKKLVQMHPILFISSSKEQKIKLVKEFIEKWVNHNDNDAADIFELLLYRERNITKNLETLINNSNNAGLIGILPRILKEKEYLSFLDDQVSC